MFQHQNHRGARRRRGRPRNSKLIWKNNERKLPQFGEENRHPSSGSSNSPNKLDPKKNTTKHVIITLPKMKEKDRNLKAAREKKRVTYKWVPIRLSAKFSKETLQARKGWKGVFEVMKSKDLQPRLLYPAKPSFRMGMADKLLPKQDQIKGVHHHQALIIWNVKGTYLRNKRRSSLWTV